MKIRVYSNNSEFIEREVTNEPMIIGRGKQTDIRIISGEISRQHARVYKEGDDCFIEDLASANGILINEKKVKIEKLSPGSPAYLGGDCRVELYGLKVNRSSHRPKKTKIKTGSGEKSVGVKKSLLAALAVGCALAIFYFFNLEKSDDLSSEIIPTKTPEVVPAKKLEPKNAPETLDKPAYCKEPWIKQLCLAFNVKSQPLYGFYSKDDNKVYGRLDYRRILDKFPGALRNDETLKAWISKELNTGIFQDLRRESIDSVTIDLVSRGYKKDLKYKQAVIDIKAFYGAIVKSDGSIEYNKASQSKLHSFIKIKRLK